MKTKAPIALLVFGVLGGCNPNSQVELNNLYEKDNLVSKEIVTQREVPVLEYRVRKGDRVYDIAEKEWNPNFHGDELDVNQSGVIMSGDKAGVFYKFSILDLLIETNQMSRATVNRRTAGGFDQDFNLFKGERLLFPDFNLDGKINGTTGSLKGHLKFDCARVPGKGLLYKRVIYNRL